MIGKCQYSPLFVTRASCVQTGLHNHIKLSVTFGITACNVSLCLYCDDNGHAGLAATLAVDEGGTVSVSLGRTTQQLTQPQNSVAGHLAKSVSNGQTVKAEIFTDGVITELFAGEGEVALSHTADRLEGSGVGYMAGARGELQLWGMKQSVF